MMPNMLYVALAALIPLVVGFVYYNKFLFGNAWMKASGMTEEKMKDSNMLLIFGLTYVFSFIIAFMLFHLVVHQTDLYSLLVNEEGFGEEGSAVMNQLNGLMEQYGDRFRSFGHGALHGAIIGFFIGLPILMINGLFEAKKLKYGFINGGFWMACLSLMGGVLCAFA